MTSNESLCCDQEHALLLKEYPGYFINRNGDVWSNLICPTNLKGELKKKKLHLNQHGYLRVNIQFQGKQYRKLIHRLLAETFIPNPENKSYVNHINGIKTDNRIENLEWCTSSENNSHAFRTGLKRPPREITIIQCDLDGNPLQEFLSLMEAQRSTGIHNSNIGLAARGKLKQAGGYKWKRK